MTLLDCHFLSTPFRFCLHCGVSYGSRQIGDFAKLASLSSEGRSTATPETRAKVGRVLLDYMRRELAIKVDYLDQDYQERIQQQSSQRLVAPWALDENESKELA